MTARAYAASLPDVFRRRSRLPTEAAISVLARKWTIESPAITDVAPDRIRVLLTKLLAAHRVDDWSSFRRRDWRQVAAILWMEPLDPLPARIPGMIERLIAALDRAGRRAWPTLIHAYLRSFNPSLPGFNRVIGSIRDRLGDVDHPELRIWQARDQRAALFSPDLAAAKIASMLAETPEHADALLADLGLDAMVLGHNLGRAIHRNFLGQVRDRLARTNYTRDWFDAALACIDDGKSLIHPTLRGDVTCALLDPFANGDSVAPPDIRATIRKLILDRVGDPRFEPDNWHAASETARSVMRRWLVGETIEAFFRLINQTAEHDSWPYRRAFWLAVHRRGLVSDACIVLGRKARENRSTRRSIEMRTSEFRDSEAQAALILKIRTLTVTEWTEVGKLRIWLENSRNTPALHRPDYTADELRDVAQFEFIHRNSSRYSWQNNVADTMAAVLGVRLTQSEYQVR